MKNYLVIVEKAPNNFGAFSPDVLGCVSSGVSVEETLAEFREALRAHFEMMIESGEDIPEARAAEYHVATYRNEGIELYNPEFIWAFIPAEDVMPEFHLA
ncbi:MAG: type II toxin-antitoxin system HicB family antitoxin [Candidatus Kapabacteria bacterium]|jgi:predicted RNase H-like HicB family nuclease|nr:type II toxin-antitoxin system HicB family antitoxin [Candidatus Kapabacteria bacterium]